MVQTSINPHVPSVLTSTTAFCSIRSPAVPGWCVPAIIPLSWTIRNIHRSARSWDWLDYNGYAVVTKPLKEFTDASGRRKFKGNMDIELAVDAMEMAENLDHIVLFSGDGDFRRLSEALQRRGLRVTVVSTIKTQPPMIADELRRQADTFLELQDLAPFIAREHRAGPTMAPAPRMADDVEDNDAVEGDDEDDRYFEPA